MMYLALSYDHRIIDGREAVSFLARVKEMVEDLADVDGYLTERPNTPVKIKRKRPCRLQI